MERRGQHRRDTGDHHAHHHQQRGPAHRHPGDGTSRGRPHHRRVRSAAHRSSRWLPRSAPISNVRSENYNKECHAMTASPSELQLEVFVSPAHPIGNDGLTFSPTTSTVIYGQREAVLVDAQFIRSDIQALGDLIEKLGRTLTTIFITHGHVDHYFGIDVLAQRFPGVRVVATSKVVDDIVTRGQQDLATFSSWFGDGLVVPTSIPEPLAEGGLLIE